MSDANDLIVAGELILSGDILVDEYAAWMWEEDVYICPSMVRAALALLPAGPLTVRLNSHGGHTAAGEAIRAMLAERDRTSGPVTIIVEGVAMSAATLILMAGSNRLMTAGSILMIHNPSGGAWGEAADLRKEADVLDLLGQVFAAVYAQASGLPVATVLEIMAAETYYGPQDAIEAGFVHGLAGDAPAPVSPESLTAAQAAAAAQMTHAAARVMSRRRQQNDAPARAGVHSPAAAASELETAPAAMIMESVMTTKPLAVNPAAPTTLAAPVDPVAAERARARSIREMAAPFVAAGRVEQSAVDALIDDGTSADAAASRLLSSMAATEPAQRPAARILRDEGETQVEGMIGALMGDTTGPAAQYRGMRVKSLARTLAGQAPGYNDIEAVRRGMRSTTIMAGAHGVSDFAYITTEVMNRSLIRAYQARPANWTAVCGAPITAADFRELHAVRFGGDFQLKPVQANGEYVSATLKDEAEGLKVERRGRTINLTFEAVVNDDMGAFQRIPGEFAMAARSMEAQIVWALIRSNAALKSDNVALFHADHGNLAGAGAAISVTTVGAGRAAMWKQKALGRKSTDDDFMMVEADRLIVPPALETVALQFVTQTTPNADGSVNPYKSTLTPVVVPHISAAASGGSDTAWYLVSSQMPPIQHAYLEGYEAPTVVTREGMNPDMVVMDARHIFGAAVHEYRGAYKNAGA